MISSPKKHKKIIIVTFMIIALVIIVLLPFLINWIYIQTPPNDFWNVQYDEGDILSFYGTVLSFIGTLSLGIITIIQNQIAQRKTDEVNKLQLELTKKSMAMAEKNYSQPQNNSTVAPKFEIKNSGCSGTYQNLQLNMKNVSSFIVSNLKSVSFEVYDSTEKLLLSSDSVKFKSISLTAGQETIVEVHNSELCTINQPQTSFNQSRSYWEQINLIWKFACEDENYKVHYFKASLHVENTQNFTGDSWNVNLVG